MKSGLVRASWIASFIGLVALTAFGARELDLALTARMEALKTGVLKTLETMAGRTISYGEISPSLFRRISVRELVINDSQDPPHPLLTIHEVQVFYSLFHLLFSQDPVGAIREVRLMNSRFTVDMERDHDVVDLLQRLLKAGGGDGLRARVSGSDIGITVVQRGSTIDLSHHYFQVEAQSPSIAISLQGGVAARETNGFWFDSVVKAQGTVDRSLSGSDMQVRLVSFHSSVLDSSAQTVQVIWKGSSLEVHKIQDRSPVVLDMYADLTTQRFTLNFQCQDLRPERLVSFSRGLSRYNDWLQLPLTASGHVTYEGTTRQLEYEADVSAFLEDQLPLRGAALSTTVRGTEKEMFFEPLRIASNQGTMEFEGSVLLDSLYPAGLLSMSGIETGNGQKLEGQVAIERGAGGLLVHGSHLKYGELGFDSVQLSVTPLTQGAAFTLLTSFSGAAPGHSLQATGEVHFGATLSAAVGGVPSGAVSAPTVSVSTSLRDVPPAKLYQLLLGAGPLSVDQQDVYNLLTHYSVSTEATVTTDFSALSVAARSVSITSNDDPSIGFHFGLALDKSHLSLTSFTGTWKGVAIQGGFEGDLGEGGQIGFATNVSLLGNSYFFTGRYSQTSGLTATGSYGLSVSAVPLRGGGALIRLKAEKLPLPLAQAPLPVSFDASGLVTAEGDWSADLPSVTIYDLPLPQSPHSVVQLSGRITPHLIDVSSVSVTTAFGFLSGTARADLSIPPDPFSPSAIDSLSLKGAAALHTADAAESYAVTGSLSGGALAVEVHFDGVPVTRLGISEVTGTLSGSASVNGPLAQPAADLVLSLKQGKLGTDPLSLDGRVELRSGRVAVHAVSASYLAHRLSAGEGFIDTSKGTFSFTGLFQTEVFADPIGLTLGVQGSLATAGTDAGEGIFGMGLQGTVSLSGITVAGTAFPSWAVTFKTAGGRISLDGGPGNSIHGWVEPQIQFFATFLQPLPITGKLQGRVDQGVIHATAEVDSLDLQILNPILKSPSINMGGGPAPVIRFTSGIGAGRLVVDGEVNDPDITGLLDLVGGGIVTAYSPDEAGPVRTSLIFEGKSFRIPKTIASAGAARMSASASFTIDHWIPTNWDVTLATENRTAVRVRTRFGVLNADGLAAGTLHVSGDERRTSVGGALTVSDCRITLGKASAGKFVPEEPPTIADVTVQTGHRVEFQWPSADVPVVRTTATPGGKVAISYRGDTGDFTVKGATDIQGGEIYYFDRSFIMKRGSLTFNENQATFDPWITARAEAREWDQATGSEVRIFLDADSPFSKFSPRFSSDPPRTDTEILAMIGAPFVNRAESQGIGMAAFLYSDILSQNLILRPFEQKVRQTLNLDMFSVRTQIIQNLAAQKVLGTTVNPLDNTSLSIGKYLGNDLFLEMLVRLQQPQVPVAVITSGGGLIAESFALQAELELDLEWATPFFLMEWSFLPQHPQTMFLSDNSLSFSWRYSY
ncbi:MAG TPA: translocation/assembly module TamB domain-containing protein [Spirochaetia bacterium]|nr:translocation/assembly module TamB domain-containing protein [Spirochaetia bacterium]